jgi:thiamine kinase-like enzyme
MTENLNAFEAIALVPDWDPATFEIEELKGGLTNRTYHLRRGSDEFVLRLDATEAGFFKFDRTSELVILAAAGRQGLAPQVIHADRDRGVLVTRFLQGRAWQESDLESQENLEALANLIRSVHTLPLSGHRINVLSAARNYESYLEKRHGLHSFATRCVEIIGQVPVHEGAVCCHNDVVAANVIEGSDIRLIDWEFACDNDPMFDLASVIGFHNLDERSSTILLDAYAGGIESERKERLGEQIRVYDAIQWLWLASRHLVFPSRVQARRLEVLQQRIG